MKKKMTSPKDDPPGSDGCEQKDLDVCFLFCVVA